jgi:hypothetical protein
MTVFNIMRDSYLAHLALADAAARTAALRERGPFKPTQVESFNAGPGDIRVFADMLERCLKLATTITVARYYGDHEELGMAYFLSVFTGDAASQARTAFADTPLSDHANFLLHGALLALLRAYLPPSDGKELRLACAQFVFLANFARGWTELVRLYDLQCAIAELTVKGATRGATKPDASTWVNPSLGFREKRERSDRLLRGIATGTYKIKTRGSRLGSLYYSSTNLTMDLPAPLACDINVVVKGAPVVVAVGARKDGLAVRESVLNFILPGVPDTGVDQHTIRSFVIVLILQSTH